MIKNTTIDKQLGHKTIRAFKEEVLTKEQINTLVEVAQHTSSSMFMQQFSIIHITDAEKRIRLGQFLGKSMLELMGTYLFLLLIYIEIKEFVNNWVKTMEDCIKLIFFCREWRILF